MKTIFVTGGAGFYQVKLCPRLVLEETTDVEIINFETRDLRGKSGRIWLVWTTHA